MGSRYPCTGFAWGLRGTSKNFLWSGLVTEVCCDKRLATHRSSSSLLFQNMFLASTLHPAIHCWRFGLFWGVSRQTFALVPIELSPESLDKTCCTRSLLHQKYEMKRFPGSGSTCHGICAIHTHTVGRWVTWWWTSWTGRWLFRRTRWWVSESRWCDTLNRNGIPFS